MRLKLSGMICLLAITMVAVFAARPGGTSDSFRQGEIIVALVPGANIEDFNARHGTFTLEQIPGTANYRLGLSPGVSVGDKLEEVTADEAVDFAQPNFDFLIPELRQVSHAFLDPADPAFIDGQSPSSFYNQPLTTKLHLAEAHQYTRGAGVKVAIIDTGLDFNHPLLAGRIAWPNYDFVDQDGYPNDEPNGAGSGHGSFIAGLIALTAPQATIMPLRAFSSEGQGTSFNIAKAIRFATDNGALVINLSFGLMQEDELIKDALEYAYQKVYMVAAAGNDNLDFVQFPAVTKSKTLSVTSTTDSDLKAGFANFSINLQVSAPGVRLYSAYPGGRWAYWSGTSFSTALVSGEAALLRSLDPKLNRSDLNKIITSSGVDINSLNPSYSGKLGKVRIDYLAAVNCLLSGCR